MPAHARRHVSMLLQGYGPLRHLRSFPPRRSSDLVARSVLSAALPFALICAVVSSVPALSVTVPAFFRKGTRVDSSHWPTSYAAVSANAEEMFTAPLLALACVGLVV